MKKIFAAGKELLLITVTVLLSLGLFFLAYDNILVIRKYYEIVAYIIYSDYIRFKGNLGYFYLVWFVLLRIVPVVFCSYYILKQTREWLKAKDFFLKKQLGNFHGLLRRQNIYLRLFHVSVVVLVLFIAERKLRKSGFNPGCFYTSYVPVDSLKGLNPYYSDSGGLIRIDRESGFAPTFLGNINLERFRSKYEYDSSSIALLKKQGKKLIMFIGDSFTEGSTAFPHDSCFVELADKSPNYCSFNFGVGTTDPLQYKLVAERYIPLIKPDAVVVQTYANDIMQYERVPTPGIPLAFFTNASPRGQGWDTQKPLELGFKPNDVLQTAEEANEFYKKFSTVPQDNFVGRLCSKSVVTTIAWRLLNPTGNVFVRSPLKNGLPYTYNNLKAIQQLCDSLHTPVVVFHILSVEEYLKPHTEMVAKYSPDFREVPVHYISGLTVSDHVGMEGDTHFNNKGHAKFATFVTAVLDSVFAANK